MFKFATGLHTVFTVPTEAAFDGCDLSEAKVVSTEGPAAVTIDASPGETLYFVCTVSTHCLEGGQKLEVVVS